MERLRKRGYRPVSLTVGYEEERSLCVVLDIAADDLVRVLFNQHDGDECFPRSCA